VQNHVIPETYLAGEPPFDGVAEAWFDDVDAMRTLAPTPEYRAVRDDEPLFLDVPAMKVVLAGDFVAKEGAELPGALKEISFLRRKPELSPAQFQRHWRDVHAPLAARLPLLRRYVQSLARLGGYTPNREPAFDGLAFAWFDESAHLAVARDSREAELVRVDETHFLAGAPLFVLAHGVEIAL
jgi:uncharacterized protein (TIGR02118 family)